MNEVVLSLPSGALGILTMPSGAVRSIAVVLPNAGRIHRSGPFRLHVELARALAEDGYPVLRIDAAGIGDAAVAAQGESNDYLVGSFDAVERATGCRRFVVGGICSAADEAWLVARRDARVCGLILIDAVAKRGFWYLAGRISLAMRRPARRWWAQLAAMARRSGTNPQPQLRSEDYREWPQPEDVRPQFAQLLDRGTNVLALYTGGAAGYFTHPRQFASTFGEYAAHPRVRFLHWPDVDHLFFVPDQRRRLYATILFWLRAWQ